MAFTTALRTGPDYSGMPEVPSGSKPPILSPSPDISMASNMGSNGPDDNLVDLRGEAACTIPEECERLFCDKLSAIFLGERRLQWQESLGIDASQFQRNNPATRVTQIQKWVEVMDYTSDTIYRGFVTDISEERTLFVFFADNAFGPGLKTGLIALFELAAISALGCSQIVACIPRTGNGAELEISKTLGWCGFGLTTLQPWDTGDCLDCYISPKWLFLSAEA